MNHIKILDLLKNNRSLKHINTIKFETSNIDEKEKLKNQSRFYKKLIICNQYADKQNKKYRFSFYSKNW